MGRARHPSLQFPIHKILPSRASILPHYPDPSRREGLQVTKFIFNVPVTRPLSASIARSAQLDKAGIALPATAPPQRLPRRESKPAATDIASGRRAAHAVSRSGENTPWIRSHKLHREPDARRIRYPERTHGHPP